MFAGMALNRAFGGIVKSQMQLFGVSDMLSSMWTLIMLPLMEKIVPIIMKVIEWFMNLPDPIKQMIAEFILAAVIVGGFLLVIGQLALALNSIAGLLGEWFGFKVPGAALVGVFGGIFAAVMSIIHGFAEMGGEGENIIEKLLNKFVDFIKKITGSFGDGFELIKKIMTGDFEFAWDAIMDYSKDALKWFKEKILDGFKWIWDRLKEQLPPWMKDAMDMGWDAALDFMKELRQAKSLGEAFMVLVRHVGNWGEIGIYIAKQMFKGIMEGLTKKISRAFGFGGGGGGGRSYQTGGLVTTTGPAFLHAGERVIPKGRRGMGELMFAPTVYITASINNEMDIRILADKLNRYWASDFERMLKGRGSY
jgi:hypothetical protein